MRWTARQLPAIKRRIDVALMASKQSLVLIIPDPAGRERHPRDGTRAWRAKAT